MKVITNGKARPIIDFSQLTEKEQKEFDYFDSESGCGNFVRYRGRVYDLGQFIVLDSSGELGQMGWVAAEGQSAFDCVMFKPCKCNPDSYVVMGRAHW